MVAAAGQGEATILVVDDVPSNVQVLAEMLRPEFSVIFALSGAEALRLTASQRPDLILLDVMMPDMDGFEVCRQLQMDPVLREIPVIFVTAMNEAVDETRGLEAGAIDYLSKPAHPAIVRQRLRNHLQLKRQRDLLRRMAFIDGLTGLANRRKFDETLESEWRRAQRRQQPIALLLADIDHFKAYNDHYGHVAGDDCLRAVARAIAEQMKRSGDLAARYGGEEMVCILPNTDLNGARSVAEEIRADLARRGLPHHGSPVAAAVTVSVGVACATPTTEHQHLALLALADQQLYEAKRGGRDCICAAALP
jgi:diguanylate cyclase (GGDEF)-like protein